MRRATLVPLRRLSHDGRAEEGMQALHDGLTDVSPIEVAR
jgi:hypothetical protein